METIEITNGDWHLLLSAQGQMLSLESTSFALRSVAASPHLCEISSDGTSAKLAPARLTRRTKMDASFEVPFGIGIPAKLLFNISLSALDEKGAALLSRMQIVSERPPQRNVRLRWFWNLRLTDERTMLFAPLFEGLGLRTTRSRRCRWNYLCAGAGGEGERLALPLVDESSPDGSLHTTYMADPFFSTGIALDPGNAPDLFECEFLAAAGAAQFPERTFGLYLHQGTAETALEGFFTHMLPGSGPGPAWLHEIAMVDYDYLSEKGQGWYRDIDRLSALIEEKDRGKVALTLHGWYDLLGRYCFDPARRLLDREWTAMPGSLKQTMTLDEVHARIAYAKERGFRVLLYFADGMAIDAGASGFGEEIVFREPDGTLRKHHWSGPDTIAQTYVMNPTHPAVKEFFRGYMRALLEEFGSTIDGLVWDETFTTRVGDLSGPPHAGYADREFMLLCAELRAMVKEKDPDLVLLASDDVGLALPQEEDGSYWRALPAQNALVFDGTYQDSQCYPTAWQYGLFPNYRNVLWSCNWKPVEHFEWTVLGVRAFGAPVAISNGWGEDRGISRYGERELKAVMELFAHPREHPHRVRWIECTDF